MSHALLDFDGFSKASCKKWGLQLTLCKILTCVNVAKYNGTGKDASMPLKLMIRLACNAHWRSTSIKEQQM